jgi:hypothetical protein
VRYTEYAVDKATCLLVADNHANTEGSGLSFDGYGFFPASARLRHTTIADNRGSGRGVFVGDWTALAFTNTVIAGHHSVGVTVTTGSTATLAATLWHANGSDTGGGGVVVSSTNVTGESPAFANPAAWDYHLSPGSAAIDSGVDAGVADDIEGDPRPAGPGYDLGADEFWYKIYLPLTLRQYSSHPPAGWGVLLL